MQIRECEIESKKKIGTWKGRPVIQLALKGGFNLVVSTTSGGGVEYMGAGPHQAVSKHLARKKYPEMVLTELSKSEAVPEESFARLLPEYQKMTDQLNRASKK